MISSRAAKVTTWASSAFVLALLAGGVAMTVMNRSTVDSGTASFYVVLMLSAASFATVGGLIARRHRSNPIGWLFCLISLAFAMLPFAQEYAIRGRYLSPGSLPAANWFGFATNWLFLVVLGPIALVFLLFPNGRPLSRRWRVFVWAAGLAGGLLSLTEFFSPDTATGTGGDRLAKHGGAVRNPLAIAALKPHAGAGAVFGLVGLSLFVATVAGIVSLAIRLRRTKGAERQQVRWLAYTGGTAVLLVPFLPLGVALNNNIVGGIFWFGVTTVLALGIPAASGIAILKYRLYDLDVVVKKTVVFGGLAAFATLVYLAVVVGIGAAIGNKGNGALTLAAAAIVAIAFQPLRTRARHLADRLIYGKRATPYEVLSEFSGRMSRGYSTEDVLPQMARLLGEGTGGEWATVWLRVGTELRLAGAWPSREGSPIGTVGLDQLDRLPGVGRSFPVRHQGELLGALGVTVPPAEPLTPSQERLIADLASQGGLVLRNVRLIEELRASRQRLVTAQDAERRRLERNIHDGAQQQLVALAVKLRLVRQLGDRDPGKAAPLLEQLERDVATTLEDLRDLARGIYPPLLADKGLIAALDSQIRRAAIPVTLEGDGIGRYGQEAEAAVYFCVLEALQNVAKYAGATHAEVGVSDDDGQLAFTVTDDGAGFDASSTSYGTGLQGMADRLSALGGILEVRSAPGDGTTVTGRVPVTLVESVGEQSTTGRVSAAST